MMVRLRKAVERCTEKTMPALSGSVQASRLFSLIDGPQRKSSTTQM
jgi:hypothetical protein